MFTNSMTLLGILLNSLVDISDIGLGYVRLNKIASESKVEFG